MSKDLEKEALAQRKAVEWQRYLESLPRHERSAAKRSVREFSGHAMTWPSRKTYPRFRGAAAAGSAS